MRLAIVPRCTRPLRCSSVVGFQGRSRWTITDAPRRSIPSLSKSVVSSSSIRSIVFTGGGSMANCSRFSARRPMGRIADLRLAICDRQQPGAAVIGGGDDCSRATGVRGGEHGARDLVGRTEGHGADGRT